MIQARKLEREAMRKKIFYVRSEEERLKKLQEEEEARKREEAEQRREEAERKAKLDEIAEKQRQRERELDEKAARSGTAKPVGALVMLELVGQYGPGVVAPTSQLISGQCLEEEIATIKNYLAEYKASWAVTGCSIMADSWLDTEGRTLINFLASGPNGVYFVSSIDATEIVKDASELFELLDKVVEEMGEENVVQVITPNTPSYKAAGKMLGEKRKNLFWTPCVTNCIDQILKHLSDIPCVAECIKKSQKITKLIYSQIWLLNFMKNGFTQGKELLRPSITEFASSFATLQSLVDHRIGLRRMFRSNKWISSQCSRAPEGKEVANIVSDAGFWKNLQVVKNSADPMMQILQKVILF
ncbi:hypothetical protein ACLB2K_047859 [Fragaria x ananassa]